MAPVAAAITLAVFETGIGFAAAIAIGNVVAYGALAIGASALLGALSKKPKPTASFSQSQRDRTVTVRESINPRRVIYGEARVGGTYCFIHTTGSSNEYIHLVIALAGHRVNQIGTMYFDGEEVPIDGSGNATGEYAGFARVLKRLGTDDQTAYQELIDEAPDKWTEDHRGRGVAHAYVRLKYSQDKFPNGVPVITFEVQGKDDIFDPRDSSTGYTSNAALCVADYISNQVFGLKSSYGTEILEDELIAAANICDEQITLSAGGTENRYECNGTFDMDSTPYDILTGLSGAMAGVAVAQGDFWQIHAGAWRTPELTLDEDDFIGTITTQTLITRKENFNGVKGVFTSPDNDWQATDFPAVQVASYVTADSNEEVWREVSLDYTTSATMAQRVARILLEENRRAITVTVPCKAVAYRLAPYDTVKINLSRYGWSEKTFMVKNLTLRLEDTWVVDLELRELDANAYAWTSADEGDPIPNPTTNLPGTQTVSTPGLTLSDEVVLLGSSQPSTNLIATITPATDVFVVDYEVQFRKASETEYSFGGRGSDTTYRIPSVQDGVLYYVRARSVSVLGRKSDWIEKTYTVIGQLAAPSDVSNFSVSIIDDTAYLSWNAVTDVDLSHYTIKYTPSLSGATWASSSTLVQRVGKPATSITVPALKGTYLIKAVDYVGIQSDNAALIITNVAGLKDFNAVEAIQEDPTFAGEKVQTLVNAGTLQLGYDTDFFGPDDFFGPGDFFLMERGFYSSGEYYFDGTTDLGSVYTSRVTASVLVGAKNDNADFFGSDDFFGVDDFFLAGSENWDSQLQIRFTEDDPSSSPVEWSDWSDFVLGDYTARAFQFRIVLSATEFGVTPVVSQLRVTIDMPDRVVADEDLTVTVSGLSVAFTPAFRALKGLAISGQGLQTGDYYVITNKTNEGFDVAWYNSSDVAVERTMDYVAAGYGKIQ